MHRCPSRLSRLWPPPATLGPLALLLAALLAVEGAAAAEPAAAAPPLHGFIAKELRTNGSVTVGGRSIRYEAVAGTLVVHPKGWDDVAQNADPDDKALPAQASMFYVAYVRQGEAVANRPITFVYNGGPGSSSAWLHVGAFGPRRVASPAPGVHAPASYRLTNNDWSLLDATDLVFIDAPGTGFSRLAGKDRKKAFFGVDADAQAFASFIVQYLGRYSRWNSPKFLLGESYGTLRSAVLARLLETEQAVRLNGLILISQCLSYDNLPETPTNSPGNELGYELALPSYAATAWYHHRLAGSEPLETVLHEAEQFALGDYALALLAGDALDDTRRHTVANRLHELTGLSLPYIEQSNLRIAPGAFEQELLRDQHLSIGRLDSRYTGPALNPLAEESGPDSQQAAIGASYVAAINDYLRNDLKWDDAGEFRLFGDVQDGWDWSHRLPGNRGDDNRAPNALTDLAEALAYNPALKVMLNAGYFDLATPYFQGVYELHHLPVPPTLRGNTEIRFYESGHMLYLSEPVHEALHANIAAFIAATIPRR